MKRSSFAQGDGSPHIFGPSVNEIWSRHGKDVLLYRTYGDGFYCVYVDETRETNFNYMDNFHQDFKYVRTVDQTTADAIVDNYQKSVIRRELSIAT